MPLYIYTPTLTSRITYIFTFIFVKMLGQEIVLLDNAKEFKSNIGVKLNYSGSQFSDELFFKNSQFLLQTGFSSLQTETTAYRDYTICFPVQGSAMPFDVFAAAFFLLSRYEEYPPARLDEHGRFPAEDSFAHNNNFLNKPVIDEWAQDICILIQQKYPGFKPTVRTYSYIPTIDIDRAYAWKYSGVFPRFVKNVLLLRLKKAQSIMAVKLNRQNDPFDTYKVMQRIHRNTRPVFFFLLGNRSANDQNLPHTLPAMQRLIKNIARYAHVGIHPSYWSNNKPALLQIEKSRLEAILGCPVTTSRQHFLKMELPATYRRLLEAGIIADHSMGFASQVGFRAGTCTPFNWYDLSQEKETNLLVYPFAAMEVTLQKYMGLGPEAALEVLKGLCDAVRKVGGTFITLWHNQSLTDTNDWQGWLTVHEKIVEHATANIEAE